MLRSVIANLCDKAAILTVQLLSIPVLTHVWSTDGYGIWLMLLTIPTYIALSDLGLGAAAAVSITHNVALARYDEALEALQSTVAFVMAAVGIIALAAIGFAIAVIFSLVHLGGQFSPVELGAAIIMITLYSVVLSQMSIITVVYRATHRYAYAMFYSAALIVIEGTAVLASARMLGNIAFAAGLLFLVRTIGYVVFAAILRRNEPWIGFGIAHASWSKLRELAHPSAAALALTLANALMLQGVLLALGFSVGPTAVAIFGASRTLSRIPLQISGLLLRPSLPEMTRAIAEGNYPVVHRLNRLNLVVAIVATAPFGIALTLFGQQALNLFSGGKLSASALLFGLLCLAATLNAVWTALSSPMIAVNRQGQFAYLYLVVSISATVITLLPLGTPMLTAATAMLAAEFLLLVRVRSKST